MQTWKILGLSLFAALWTACDREDVHPYECFPACTDGRLCVKGVCEDPNTPEPVRPACEHDSECPNGICGDDKRCAPPECGVDNAPACPRGRCVSNRCVFECEKTADCTDKACVNGFCVPFHCETPCNRAEACVEDAGDAQNPTKGKCGPVVCTGCGNGTCLRADNPDKPREGICRPGCIVPPSGGGVPDACITNNDGVCVSLGKPGALAVQGTCEPVKCPSPCANFEFCKSVGTPANPTAGQCVRVSCASPCKMDEFCGADKAMTTLSNPTQGACLKVKCENANGTQLCTDTQACIHVGPSREGEGKCEDVKCNGGAGCPSLTQACVLNPNAANLLEGECVNVSCREGLALFCSVIPGAGTRICVAKDYGNPRQGVCLETCEPGGTPCAEQDVCEPIEVGSKYGVCMG